MGYNAEVGETLDRSGQDFHSNHSEWRLHVQHLHRPWSILTRCWHVPQHLFRTDVSQCRELPTNWDGPTNTLVRFGGLDQNDLQMALVIFPLAGCGLRINAIELSHIEAGPQEPQVGPNRVLIFRPVEKMKGPSTRRRVSGKKSFLSYRHKTAFSSGCWKQMWCHSP